MDHNIKTQLDENGVLLASIDMAGKSMNVFSLDMMDSLERLLGQVETGGDIKAVVLTSGKSAFLAGADLDMIRMFTERALTDTHQQLDTLCGRLGRLFRRLEKSRKPYVAAINGLALGGGLEISLACHGRVVVDDKKAQLGLPEIKLGLLPGAGGTQRLPRIAGTTLGLRMLLEGNSLAPAQALAAGIVDEVVAADQLIATAKRRALSLIGAAPKPWDRPEYRFDSAPFDFSRDDRVQQIASAIGISEHQLQHYPAYKAIMACVTGGWSKPFDAACDWEMTCFVHLIQDPVAGNMVRTLFLNRQRAAKVGPVQLNAKELRVAVSGAQAASVHSLLQGLGAPLVGEPATTVGATVLTFTGTGLNEPVCLQWLTATATPAAGSAVDGYVCLGEMSPHGQILEVCTPAGSALASDAGLVLARWLRATPWLTYGVSAVLPQLQTAQRTARKVSASEAEELMAVALAAEHARAQGAIPDTELADVAIVIASLHPAYSGGPFTYLRQTGASQPAGQALTSAAA